MNTRTVVASVLCAFAVGCSNPQAPAPEKNAEKPVQSTSGDESLKSHPAGASALDESGPVDLVANVDMPKGFETIKPEPAECMTPVDYFNGEVVESGSYKVGDALIAEGWNITSVIGDPTPNTVFGVFKPYDSTQKGVVLNGARENRADVAAGNAAFLKAGFRLEGVFPAAPGKYRFYLWTGDSTRLIECDSRIVIQVQ